MAGVLAPGVGSSVTGAPTTTGSPLLTGTVTCTPSMPTPTVSQTTSASRSPAANASPPTSGATSSAGVPATVTVLESAPSLARTARQRMLPAPLLSSCQTTRKRPAWRTLAMPGCAPGLPKNTPPSIAPVASSCRIM